MSDPRPRLCDETPAPAWMLPRYGVRAALRAWALAIVLGCALYACATHAHGQAPAAPASIAMYNADGTIACHMTPTASGLRTAGHCLWGRDGAVNIHGTRYRASIDDVRDLGHVLAPAYASDAHERTPNSGEAVEWRNTRGVGGGTVQAVWWARGRGIQGGDVNSTPGPGVDWYPVLVMCRDHGRRVIHGDSGSGAYAAADGALVAIVIRASLDDWTDHAGPCDGAQWVIGVMVP